MKDLLSQIKYPEAHMFADEIKEIKGTINNKYKDFQDIMNEARKEYSLATSHMKSMAEKQKQAIELLKSLTDDFEHLDEVVTRPLLP